MLKKWLVIFALIFSIGSTTLLIAGAQSQEDAAVSSGVSDGNSTACNESLTACTKDLAECNKSLAALKDPKTGLIVQCEANKATALAAQEAELKEQFEADKADALAAQEAKLKEQFEADKADALAAQEAELKEQYEADKADALAAQEAELQANCSNEKDALQIDLQTNCSNTTNAIQANLNKCQNSLNPICSNDYCDNICTNLQVDSNNCGKCGNVCDTLPHVTDTHCYNGICRVDKCAKGWGNCDHVAKNGCETNLGNKTSCTA